MFPRLLLAPANSFKIGAQITTVLGKQLLANTMNALDNCVRMRFK